MKPFEAEGHRGNRITLDICERCHQVWFDERESIGLGSAGWARVLEHLLHLPTPLSAPDPKQAYTCPRCEEPLALLHNVSRYGRYRLHACSHCGGHLQQQSWLLAQHGFCRPLRGPDRFALVREGRTLDCLTCGAPIAPQEDACTYCETPPLVLDPQRLAQALLRRPQVPALAVVPTAAIWRCPGCSRPVDPTVDEHCPQCGNPVWVDQPDTIRPVLHATRETFAREAHAREVLATRLGTTPLSSGVPRDSVLAGQLVDDRVAVNQAVSRLDRPRTPLRAWGFGVVLVGLLGAWTWWVTH